jgi:hypothetical protein
MAIRCSSTFALPLVCLTTDMKRHEWKMGWAALRSLGYWRTVECYGKEQAEVASDCFLKREEGPQGVFPFAPLHWRLESFKARKANAALT